jgi:MraZ protein
MNLLTGEYNNTLDEKGRVTFPAKLRSEINQNVLIITRGLDRCLWLFTSEEWDLLKNKLMNSTSLFNEKNRMVLRHFIAPAQEVEFDKTGRISVPQSLREYASLSKDCTILGVGKYIELWNSTSYDEYLCSSEASFKEAAEELNNINF